MAVVSRPHVAPHGAGLDSVLRGLFYLTLAIVAIAIGVPAAIATVG